MEAPSISTIGVIVAGLCALLDRLFVARDTERRLTSVGRLNIILMCGALVVAVVAFTHQTRATLERHGILLNEVRRSAVPMGTLRCDAGFVFKSTDPFARSFFERVLADQGRVGRTTADPFLLPDPSNPNEAGLSNAFCANLSIRVFHSREDAIAYTGAFSGMRGVPIPGRPVLDLEAYPEPPPHVLRHDGIQRSHAVAMDGFTPNEGTLQLYMRDMPVWKRGDTGDITSLLDFRDRWVEVVCGMESLPDLVQVGFTDAAGRRLEAHTFERLTDTVVIGRTIIARWLTHIGDNAEIR